jgi:hypothetical protein
LPEKGRAPIARRLVEQHGFDLCFKVPGIIKKTNELGDEYVTLAGSPGIVVPTRIPGGKIHSLCVRKDGVEKNKYVWLSSKKSNGVSPGLVTHVPLGIQYDSETIRLTEGTLKSDVAFAVSGIPTIGVPGIGNWETALPVLKLLGAKKVIFSPDADFREKPQVARPCCNCLEGLLSAGFDVDLEVWQ